MRTVLGSAVLIVGGFLLLATLLTVTQWPGVALWVKLAGGGGGVVLAVAGVVLLLGQRREAGRRVVVLLTFVGGLAGMGFALGSKNHQLGKYCGMVGAPGGYRLTVRAFGKVLHEETGPAVRREEGGETVVGPSAELETKMVCWELGLDVVLIAAGAFLGGVLGLGIRYLARSPRTTGPAGVAPGDRAE
jgi:hypothetical protein